MFARLLCAVVVGGTLVASAPAAAAAAPANIDAREHRQMQRIRQGWRDGSLTRAETRRLMTEQRAIRAEERVFRRGGLNPWERRQLQRDLNRASRDIARQTHDRQRRAW